MTFYMRLQPLEQFEIVAMVAGMCLFFSVILMELFKDREIRIAARALGCIGVVVLAAFGWRMASQVQRLEHQIAARSIEVSQDVSDVVLRTPKGYEFAPGVVFDGLRDRTNDLRDGFRRYRRSENHIRNERSRETAGTTAGNLGDTGGRNAGNHGTAAAEQLLEHAGRWLESAASDWRGNAPADAAGTF
jgi:hypothetical protein